MVLRAIRKILIPSYLLTMGVLGTVIAVCDPVVALFGVGGGVVSMPFVGKRFARHTMAPYLEGPVEETVIATSEEFRMEGPRTMGFRWVELASAKVIGDAWVLRFASQPMIFPARVLDDAQTESFTELLRQHGAWD